MRRVSMRAPALVLAWLALAALIGSVAALGCDDLSSNCELQVSCTPVTPPPDCKNIFDPAATCASCAEAACCQEASDCKDNGSCLNVCVSGAWPPAEICATAAVKQVTDRLVACLTANCSPACDVVEGCDPILGTGCGPTASCEPFQPGVLECLYPFSNSVAKLCEPCDLQVDPICGPGMHCFAGSSQCARYCCDDADCGTGKCALDQTMVFGAPLLKQTKLGICLTMDGAAPACDAPAISPSKGSCLAVKPPP
jgi:hypothetical protein